MPLAVACSSESRSPVRQFTAFRPRTYWLPKLEIEPSMVAALAVRWQTSRASSGVSRASFGWFISCQRLGDALVRNQAEKGRLLQLRR